VDPAAVSELVVRVLQCWVRTWWSESSGGGHAPGGQDNLMVGTHTRGWPPLLLYPSGARVIVSRKFLKMSQWAWGEGVLVVSHSSPKGKCSASLPA